MSSGKGDRKEDLKNGAKDVAHSAKQSRWVDIVTRLGYATRGLLYGMIGWLAIQLIFTGRGKLADREGALATLAQEPYGKVLLIIVVAGAVGMLLWGLIRAVADPLNKGSDLKGYAARAGYLVTGISYGALVIPAFTLLFGGQTSDSQEAGEQAAAGVLTRSWGPWLVGGIGVALIIIGAARAYRAVKNDSDDRFKLYEMTQEQKKIAETAGRVGGTAQGIVLSIIGVLALLAALTLDPQKVGGVDGALAFLAQQPYGPYLLAAVALGLIAYAVYSFMGAIWFRIKEL